MLERYSRPQISPEVKSQYEEALSKIPRWKNALTPSTKEESDLDHVTGLFDLADEVKQAYPELAEVVDWTAIEDMIYIHDAGEIISGDYVISNPNPLMTKEKHKRRERLGFHYMNRKFIKDPYLRRKAAETYQRYIDCSPDDKEALLVHLLDKIQAIRFGLENVYNNKRSPSEKSLQHATFSVDLIFQFGIPLLDILEPVPKSNLASFIQVEFGRYRDAGYQQITDEGRRRLSRSNRQNLAQN